MSLVSKLLYQKSLLCNIVMGLGLHHLLLLTSTSLPTARTKRSSSLGITIPTLASDASTDSPNATRAQESREWTADRRQARAEASQLPVRADICVAKKEPKSKNAGLGGGGREPAGKERSSKRREA